MHIKALEQSSRTVGREGERERGSYNKWVGEGHQPLHPHSCRPRVGQAGRAGFINKATIEGPTLL